MLEIIGDTKAEQKLNHPSSNRYLGVVEAATWASKYTGREITSVNISYLIQYGRIQKIGTNGTNSIDRDELKKYYDQLRREDEWKSQLGDDLNWDLSFEGVREKERTKHVHRLHPYKGKYIPQLVEYFLDRKTDNFKQQVFFSPTDIVLDPFCGSGTTLVQANELGIHGVGIDISSFNCMISNVKVQHHDVPQLHCAILELTRQLEKFVADSGILEFDEALASLLTRFNAEHFPSPQYRRDVASGAIDEASHGHEKEQQLASEYHAIVTQQNIDICPSCDGTFLSKWLMPSIRKEVLFLRDEIAKVEDTNVRSALSVILSRTVRSCRATKHADLGTLKEPTTGVYYCKKHGKMCKPLFSMLSWWKRYSIDTLQRFQEFDKLKTATHQVCVQGDSRAIDLIGELTKVHSDFSQMVAKHKIKGIFSSPPYVGLINYHEQHAYAYELFDLARDDDLEIGPLFSGQGKKAKENYVTGIAECLIGCKPHLQDNYDVFLVANDKHGLYPSIADRAEMEIVNQFQRPVLCRVEKDRSTAFSETIFHLKDKTACRSQTKDNRQ